MKAGKNQSSFVITLYLFSCLLALFWGRVYELMGIWKVGAVLLEPHVQYIFHWLFSRWDLANYFPRVALTATLPNSVSHVPKITTLSHQCLIILVYHDTKMCLPDSGWDSSTFTLKLFTHHF
jgi:isoprenylcysteine carboxyl methyltransferase (ICMT) family protein YpbQ